MKKTFASIALLALTACGAAAQDYKSLTLRLADGSECAFTVGSGIKIAFSEDRLLVTTAQEEKSFALADVSLLSLVQDATAIHLPVAAGEGDREAVVYTLDGRLVPGGIGSLPKEKGIYIIRRSGKTEKIMVR